MPSALSSGLSLRGEKGCYDRGTLAELAGARRKHLIQPGNGRDMVREAPWGKRLWWQKLLYVFRFPKAVSSLFSLGTRLNYVSHPPLHFSFR